MKRVKPTARGGMWVTFCFSTPSMRTTMTNCAVMNISRDKPTDEQVKKKPLRSVIFTREWGVKVDAPRL